MIKRRNNYVYMSYGPSNCGGFGDFDIEVKGDTITIASGLKKGGRIWYYYIKTDIPVD